MSSLNDSENNTHVYVGLMKEDCLSVADLFV